MKFLYMLLVLVLVNNMLRLRKCSILKEDAMILDNHHTNEQVYAIIENVNKKCPRITYIYDLSKMSTSGVHPLRVIAFSNNPSEHELLEPEFKYVGNMHGNEVVGREMMLELIVQLCEGYLQGNKNIVRLIESTRMHFLITMNPDGWDLAVENEFESLPAANNEFANKEDMLRERGVLDWYAGRENANGVDLNRNFPDLDEFEYKYVSEKKEKFDHLIGESASEFNDDKRDCKNNLLDFLKIKYQNETIAVAKWILENPFVLSANFHGGDLVVNYPYDDSKTHQSVYSSTPDDALFRDLSEYFANNHKTMASNETKPCEEGEEEFHNSITNGAAWYAICGGMQDYNYLVSNCFELTIELGCEKFPPGNTLKQLWIDNLDAFYEYIWLVHRGIKGIVTDGNNKPIVGAKVEIEKEINNGQFELIKHHVETTSNGEYWRLLSTGNYRIKAVSLDNATSNYVLETIVDSQYTQAKIVNLRLN